MNSTTLTIVIAVAFLILAVVTSFISARIGSPKRFTPEWWSNWIQGLSTELVGGMGLSDMYGLIKFARFVRFVHRVLRILRLFEGEVAAMAAAMAKPILLATVTD